ncbi:MAG: hypothetical protein HQK91_10405 [Nitrospirae bacterium]|nr:hypothetical protein [Nitrospirota bacterium]
MIGIYIEDFFLIISVLCVLRMIACSIMISQRPLTAFLRKITKVPQFPINLTPQDIEQIRIISEKEINWKNRSAMSLSYKKRNAAILLELDKGAEVNINLYEKLRTIYKVHDLVGYPDVTATENMIYKYHKYGIKSAINYYEGSSVALPIAIICLIFYFIIHNGDTSLINNLNRLEQMRR